MSKARDRRKRAKMTRAEATKLLNEQLRASGATSRYDDGAPEMDWTTFDERDDPYFAQIEDLMNDPEFQRVVEQGKELDAKYRDKIDRAREQVKKVMLARRKERLAVESKAADQTRVETLKRMIEYHTSVGAHAKVEELTKELHELEGDK